MRPVDFIIAFFVCPLVSGELLRGKITELSRSEEQQSNKENENCQTRRLQSTIVDEWPNNGWEETNVKVINSLCHRDWKKFYDKAVRDWNLSTAVEYEKYSWTNGRCDSRLQYVQGYVNVVDGWWEDEVWDGFASWEYEKVKGKWRIKNALVLMNNYFLINDRSSGSYDENRSQSICHELGHAIGLKHHNEDHFNRNTGSCMDYSAAPEGGRIGGIDYGPRNTGPSARDYDDLESAYFNPSNRRASDSSYNVDITDAHTESFEQLVKNPEGKKSGKQKLNSSNIADTDTEIFEQLVRNSMGGISVEQKSHLINNVIDENKIIRTDMNFTNIGEVMLKSQCNGATETRIQQYDNETEILTVSVYTEVERRKGDR